MPITSKRITCLILAIACPGMTATSSASVQDSGTPTDRQACRTLKKLLPKANFLNEHAVFAPRLTAAHLTASGIAFDKNGKLDVEIAYGDVRHPVKRSGNCADLNGRKDIYLCFGNDNTDAVALAEADELASALNQLISSAHQGHTSSCVTEPSTDKAELVTFAEKTAAWRTQSPKPPLSDEANKKRLLAEDAIQNKDMKAAVAYYEAGVAADPTWAQGWYNAALIHAEMKEYGDAAYCMKHYLILMPDAPDSQVAKDKAILWDAKAEETRR